VGLFVKNKNDFVLSNNITEFISIPSDNLLSDENYHKLKELIYSLNIDNEDKANIINKINSLSKINSPKERTKIINEIESFKIKYNIM